MSDANPRQRRRIVPLGLVLVALLVLAALAAGGRPLGIGGSRGGGGPSAGFFDYLWTTLIVVGALWFVVVLYVAATTKGAKARVGTRGSFLSSLLLVAVAVAASQLLRHTRLGHLHGLMQTGATGNGAGGTAVRSIPPGARTASFRWDEAAVVLAAVAIALLVYAIQRRRGRPLGLPEVGLRPAAEVSAALDDAVDDLRDEPDVRRAIVAAYARTERALAASGLERRRSEAPLEYLERALAALDASGASIRRLTELFEWAKFSHHEPGPGTKDEAIDALLAVRDELRAGPRERAAA